MKKLLAILLCAAMLLGMVSLASAEGYSGDLKIWVAEAAVDFTKEQVEAFKAAHPEYAGMNMPAHLPDTHQRSRPTPARSSA